MRKLLPLILALLLCLSACSAPNPSPAVTAVPATDAPVVETKAPAAQDAAEKPATLKEAVLAAAPDAADLIPMPAYDLSDLLGIEPEDYTEQVWLQSEGLDGREILALRAADTDAAGRIETALNNYLTQRRKETQNYLPEVYKLLGGIQVEKKGLTLVLAVGANAAAETAALLAGE